jgi:hypothetical protein
MDRIHLRKDRWYHTELNTSLSVGCSRWDALLRASPEEGHLCCTWYHMSLVHDWQWNLKVNSNMLMDIEILHKCYSSCFKQI